MFDFGWSSVLECQKLNVELKIGRMMKVISEGLDFCLIGQGLDRLPGGN
jgi:hypothetical protein